MPDCDSGLTRGHVESVLAFIISDVTAFVPLETRDQQHLRAAHGYIDLGMYIDAKSLSLLVDDTGEGVQHLARGSVFQTDNVIENFFSKETQIVRRAAGKG